MPFNPFSVLTSKLFAGLSAALLLALAVQTWRVDHWQHKSETYATAYTKMRDAFETEHRSNATLINAIGTQNAAIDAWRKEGQARQSAAAAALRQATARGQALDGLADQIDRERAVRPSGGPCVSGKAVMDARGEL